VLQEDADDDALSTELISQAKQSRSEKKARKALLKLGKPHSSLPFPQILVSSASTVSATIYTE